MNKVLLGAVAAALLGCGANRVPAALRGYDIVVEPKDLQSLELAWALRHYGFRVRQKVRGGSHPTAALIYFIYGDPGEPSWFHVRLADTRSGEILRSGSVPVDSLTPSTRTRAIAAVEALIAP